MGLPYLRQNDPSEMQFVDLFHTWGDLLLTVDIAERAGDAWTEGLATRWAIVTAWSCFEIACCVLLGVPKVPQPFWNAVNRNLANRMLPSIDPKLPPWDGLESIRKQRHPFAHLGAGGGRFPKKSDGRLAVNQVHKGILRVFSLFGHAAPRWLVIVQPRSLPFRRNMGTIALAARAADPTDPKTIHLATQLIDGSEVEDYLPEGFDWQQRVESAMANLRVPIRGLRVYDGHHEHLNEPLVMWGNW